MTAPLVQRQAVPAAFTPGVHCGDDLARYWLGQVTLRLRREVAWLWHERGLQGVGGSERGALPPSIDRALAALDLQRYEHDKRAFFVSDVTARYLSDGIAAPVPPSIEAERGSFGWLVQQLRLEPVDCFVLALSLLPAIDSAAGPVIASCLNDPARTLPALALAQRLWDEPDELLRCFDPAHVLLRYGLLSPASGTTAGDWHGALSVPPMVARQLLRDDDGLPPGLRCVDPVPLPAASDPVAQARVATAFASSADASARQLMHVVPLLGAVATSLDAIAAAYAASADRQTVQPSVALTPEHIAQVLTTAWLRGDAVYLPVSTLAAASAHEAVVDIPLPGLPAVVFVGMHERVTLAGGATVLPPILVPPLDYHERLQCWQQTLPVGGPPWLLHELARRFRYERAGIARVGVELAACPHQLDPATILAAVRADLDLGTLAQPVTPRFALSELMLPAAQATQMGELVAAVNNLTRVHYEWGTARAWNESGLSALFSGPPGTGKTMAAEALAAELSLPLFRIDLSQVVNKYIGETEKNLRRLFDAADSADVILFFDEADALFGKRTEVKDAHDRYANLEISYLLERMERFKGLAILATNRRKDLDEAFLRRLRFVIEFPLPGVAERLRIWRGVIPQDVDATDVDLEFLAQRFALAGGHIRAIVFQACLQSADEGAPRRLTMPAVVRAVQREYDKLDRVNSLEQFGPYAELVAAQGRAR